MIKFINYKQCGYGQFNVYFECQTCEEEFSIHVTGHGYEDHEDECDFASKSNHFAFCCNPECPDCGETEIDGAEYVECTCDEIRDTRERERFESLSEEEKEQELKDKAEIERQKLIDFDVEKELVLLYGERPQGLTHCSAVKNWRTKRSKARAAIQEKVYSMHGRF
jgi:hypothetical protein